MSTQSNDQEPNGDRNEGDMNQEAIEKAKESRREFLRSSSRRALAGAAAAYFGLSMSSGRSGTARADICWCYCISCSGCLGCEGSCTACSSCSGTCENGCTNDCSAVTTLTFPKQNNGSGTAPDLHRSDLIQDVFVA